jgi:hypothetical protein
LTWFNNQVRSNGPWDYKQRNTRPSEFEPFGNFNYGATGTALGISANVLMRAAGWAQGKSGNKGQGSFLGSRPPFGDDYPDNINIRRGIVFYQQEYENRPCK